MSAHARSARLLRWTRLAFWFGLFRFFPPKITRARTTNSFVLLRHLERAGTETWLSKAEPNVVSLQELKAAQEAFPVNALRTLGQQAVWQVERSWNSVAILARNHPRSPGCDDQSVDQKDRGHAHAYLLEAVLLHKSDSTRPG